MHTKKDFCATDTIILTNTIIDIRSEIANFKTNRKRKILREVAVKQV